LTKLLNYEEEITMKITKQKLKQIIKEELENVQEESMTIGRRAIKKEAIRKIREAGRISNGDLSDYLYDYFERFFDDERGFQYITDTIEDVLELISSRYYEYETDTFSAPSRSKRAMR
jgi:hypothetical protein